MRKLVLAGLVAAGVVAYRRLAAPPSGPASSGPTLTSVPDATDDPRATTSHLHPVPSGPQSGASHADTAADTPVDVVFPGDDQGGSSPDEAAADLASEAETHAVTLPDQPLEEVDLTEVPDPEVPVRD